MVIVEINFLGLMKMPEKAIYPGDEIPSEDEYSLMWVVLIGVGSSSLNQVLIRKLFNSIKI